MSSTTTPHTLHPISKAASGIYGVDVITEGGLPRGRPTLVCGNAGCGKTLFAIEFLVRGAIEHGEPGIFVSFEETREELISNVQTLGFDLIDLEEKQLFAIEYIFLDRHDVEEVGDYTLDGLFIRLGHLIEQIGARRIALDTIEALFGGLQNEGIVRAELRRLFRWLKERGMTAIVTAERGDGTFTRHGIEEYVADCVILLDHRVHEQISTRRLRIVKYRGSTHGTNEYPFLINDNGITVIPITNLDLNHHVTSERISSGVAALDQMLGGTGYYRGSTVLVSGTAGTGKSSLAAAFVTGACERGETALFVTFEESPAQITRNMGSIGINLHPHIKAERLHFHAVRPTMGGLELHLAMIADRIIRLKPHVVVIDPVTALMSQGFQGEVRALLTRLIDLCKQHAITLLLNSLTGPGQDPEGTDVGVSSLVDTWLLVRNIESDQSRTRIRGLYILKSRGMAHSQQVRVLQLSSDGISLQEES